MQVGDLVKLSDEVITYRSLDARDKVMLGLITGIVGDGYLLILWWNGIENKVHNQDLAVISSHT